MKTFSEFLDEALLPSLIKAAARQFIKSKALQKAVPKVGKEVAKTVKLPSKVTGFQTGRGSKYTYNPRQGSWPQTQRTAAKDPYHPTAPGVKQKSDYTMFTTPDASMAMRQNFVSKGAVNPQTKEPFFKGLPQSPTPKKGRAPVEVWNKYAEKGGKQAIHPGSPITDIQTTTRGSNVGLYGAQRKEIRNRVKAGLQRPANIEDIKRQLGIKPKNSSTTYRNLGAGRKESVKEQKSFSQFITEAKEARPPKEVLRKIDRAYGRKYPGTNVDVSHDDKSGDLRVNQLFVPPNMQGKGIGTRVMKGLTKYADKQKKRVTLTQDPDKGKKAKLAKFYKKHGFEKNRGRSRDFTTRDTDIRNPR